jgi:DNA-binding CsgD family transcriptional regulator/PAS domain-containing protein
MDERADELIDHIYETALRPEEWQAVAEAFSAVFGGSPVAIGLLISGVVGLQPRYVSGMPPEGAVRFLEHIVEQPSWSMKVFLRCTDHFRDLSEEFGHMDLASTPIYTEWMKPRGLAPIWPAGHMLLGESNQSLGGFFVFRREGEGPFTKAELADADRFVPHLRRTVRIQARHGGAQQAHLALGEVVDRLPTGVLLLDAQRRVVVRNQAAERILALDDGFGIDRNGVSAADARENAELQKLIADALGAEAGHETAARGFAVISRPSGKRDFALMVSPLLSHREDSASSDIVAVLFVVDPEGGVPPVPEVLAQLYSLTHSEAEIVRLLSMGFSLEEAAQSRGVSINTARSHLKHAFSKTGTSRQGELVRLIVAGVGAIGEV